jgi:hypothetical protein
MNGTVTVERPCIRNSEEKFVDGNLVNENKREFKEERNAA